MYFRVEPLQGYRNAAQTNNDFEFETPPLREMVEVPISLSRNVSCSAGLAYLGAGLVYFRAGLAC